MRNLRICAAVILVAAVSLFATDIPKGTKITVRTRTNVSSDYSQFGDPVEAVLASNLVINGKVIAPEGAIAHGVVSGATLSQRNSKFPSPGSVSIRLETVETREGTYHLSTNTYIRQGSGRGSRSPIPGPSTGSSIPTGGGISIDTVGGIQRQSPFPTPDGSGGVTLGSASGPEAIIPENSIIIFRTAGVSKPVPGN